MKEKGQILIQVLLVSTLAIVIITVLVNTALFHLSEVTLSAEQEQAFEIAEAGIEYYRWHLAHAPQDFTNGTGQPGPYLVDYFDRNGVLIGQFELTITPPSVGSTVVTVRSKGILNSEVKAVRTIESKLAIPSIAKYAVAANADIRFGLGTEVFGLLHSNGGIRFDGIAHNLVTSSKNAYNDPDHSGADEFGVHTHVLPVDPFPPAAVPQRPDVFLAGRQFPVPAIDFSGFTADLADLKTAAQASGRYFANSGSQGYAITLRTDDTFDISEVTSLVAPPSGCTNSLSESGWGTWSVSASTTIGNYPIPSNGIIFVEDHVWVSGKIDGARVTIASARFPVNPSTYTSINLNSNILYTNYDGTDSIGLIAQNNVNIGLMSIDALRIDGALIAQNGRVGRYYYRQPSSQSYCGSTALRSAVTLYGMLATNQRYGFSWSCGGTYCSGYATRNIIYDANLLYNPPPNFPLTSDQYQPISWEEIR